MRKFSIAVLTLVHVASLFDSKVDWLGLRPNVLYGYVWLVYGEAAHELTLSWQSFLCILVSIGNVDCGYCAFSKALDFNMLMTAKTANTDLPLLGIA